MDYDFMSIENFGSVSIQRVRDIKPHKNNSELEIIKVLDQQVVLKKSSFVVGDYVAYCQNNVTLSEKMAREFPDLEQGVVIKKFIEGEESSGLCIPIRKIFKNLPTKTKNENRKFSFKLGDDVSCYFCDK